MKVKHKQSGVELEIKSSIPGYCVTKGGSWIACLDEEWEFIKEEQWEDMTEQCKSDYLADGFITLWNETAREAVKKDGYRLRKVQLYSYYPDRMNVIKQWAFIVERRKP